MLSHEFICGKIHNNNAISEIPRHEYALVSIINYYWSLKSNLNDDDRSLVLKKSSTASDDENKSTVIHKYPP